MNCKPGDLAIVVSEFTAGCSVYGSTGDIPDATVSTRNCTGRIVRVTGPADDPRVWRIENPILVQTFISGNKNGGWFACNSNGNIRCLPDEVLRPLRGETINQQEKDEVQA